MMQLKDYQFRVLASLRDFLQQAAKAGQLEAAFHAVVRKNTGQTLPYLTVPSFAGVPYVCLRVPTGGGKTLLACYATRLAKDYWLQAERAIVLWLVPSNTILDQTARALRSPRHPYRQALESECGPVEVHTIQEALAVPRAAVEGQTVVIVATIQSFRVEDTEGRKVYEQNGAMPQHLENVASDLLTTLETGPDGKPVPSLANVLRLHHPIVIVDEAHNARTTLSFETLARLAPACIVEFTATPEKEWGNGRYPSNVLHRVSAFELKHANMVKLPLRVITRDPSQRDQLLADAIALRDDLERLSTLESQQTAEYLRPIMLIQAEHVADCEPLREQMASDFRVPKEQVKISVGAKDELPGVGDISSPKCPVRYIITVQKLTEGWDCPFAYVLCSLKETRSATAIEQIVGRILRLPGAQAKRHADLNCSYAYSVSPSLPEVLNELREALENNGFTSAEAQRVIVPGVQGVSPLGAQPQTVVLGPGQIDATVAQIHMAALGGKVHLDAASGAVTVNAPLTDAEVETLAGCMATPESKAKVKEIAAVVADTVAAFGASAKPSPYQLGCDFKVPLLAVKEGDQFSLFEETLLMEHTWKLSEKDASLAADYNPLERPIGRAGTIDVATSGKVETNVISEAAKPDYITSLRGHVAALAGTNDWSLEVVLGWLDRQIKHDDIPIGESSEFLRHAVNGLMAKFGFTGVGPLVLDRYRLRDAIAARIDDCRKEERQKAHQMYLADGSSLTVTPDFTMNL